MVRALLDGTKTQTRRIVKPQPPANTVEVGTWHHPDEEDGRGPRFYAWESRPPTRGLFIGGDWCQPCPYGQPGDQLWVREAIRLVPDLEPDDATGRVFSVYHADGALTVADAWPWKRSYLPPMHCPRGLSRVDLEVTGVRVERLQAIDEAGAIAEGAPHYQEGTDAPPPDGNPEWCWNYRSAYMRLWHQINGAGSWDANPWVWVVEFKRVNP
nr:hypothetical protein [Variovorax sp. dw_954]